MIQKTKSQVEAALMHGAIWGLVGGIYAVLFVGFSESFRSGIPADLEIPVAAALAGAIGASFYGAMQIAIVGTLTGVVTTFGYLVMTAGNVNPLGVLIVTGVAGAMLGATFGAMHVLLIRGALAKLLSGLLGGLASGLVIWLVVMVSPVRLGSALLVGLLVPLTGYVYVVVSERLESWCGGKVPDPVVGALVAASLSAAIGGSVWAVGGAATDGLDPAYKAAIDQALDLIPSSIVGGFIGGILSGFLLGVLGRTPRHE